FHQNDYKLNFERIDLVYFRKQYLQHFNIVTFKYNRTSAVINATWTFHVDVGYDHNVIVQAYRFASNEYRLFPIRLQLNVCDAIKGNVIGLGNVIHCGNFTGCPFSK
ncbi:hypothetical protein ILUMI_14354, partial [Ignelater luminosus]